MISYPVDVQNTKWAIYDTVSAQVVKTGCKWPRQDGEEIVGADPNLVPLLEVTDPIPEFDNTIERVIKGTPVIDVPNNTYTYTWVVEPLPQQEIDDISQKQQAISYYQDLMNGVGTSAERLQRTEKVCAYLLKHIFGAS